MTFRTYEQQRIDARNRLKAYDAVICAIVTSGLTRKQIADKLGWSMQRLAHHLSTPSNWTLNSISCLMCAIDAEMDYTPVFHRDRIHESISPKSN